MKKKIQLFILLWTIGLWGGILFWLLVLAGRIELSGYRMDKFNSLDKGLLLFSNHPSLLEPIILCFLFFPIYLFWLKATPYSTPDLKNYYQKWWFWAFRIVSVPIERKRGKEKSNLRRMGRVLKSGKPLILFPEGGRTPYDRKRIGYKFSSSGKRIKRFPPATARLVEIDCKILLVWTEGGEKIIPNRLEFPKFHEFLNSPFRLYHKMRIIIGEPLESTTLPVDKRQKIEFLENSLLELSNQK